MKKSLILAACVAALAFASAPASANAGVKNDVQQLPLVTASNAKQVNQVGDLTTFGDIQKTKWIDRGYSKPKAPMVALSAPAISSTVKIKKSALQTSSGAMIAGASDASRAGLSVGSVKVKA